MFIGNNDLSIEIVQNPTIPHFTNIYQENVATTTNGINIEIFDDFTCKNCTNFATNALLKIKELEKKSKNINVTLYFTPDTTNELYYKSALSLKCAADQKTFWDMHAQLHQNKNKLNTDTFLKIAKELELEEDQFTNCMTEDLYKNKIREDFEYANGKNIKIKPTIIINNYRLIGSQPFENIEYVVNKIQKSKS